jgi:hypothetical protein
MEQKEIAKMYVLTKWLYHSTEHTHTVPTMNRLNQTEPATFSILPLWDFFRDSYFSYFRIFIKDINDI